MSTTNVMVCTRCNMILMTIDSRRNMYDREELVCDEWGARYEYVEGCDDSDHDYYICPVCGGTDGEFDATIECRELPDTVGEGLVKLYKKRQEDAKEEYIYGIKLDDPDLKITIMETELTK